MTKPRKREVPEPQPKPKCKHCGQVYPIDPCQNCGARKE